MIEIKGPLLGLEIVPQDTHVTVVTVLGIVIPVSPTQAMQAPGYLIPADLDKETAIAKAKELLAAAEALPDTSKQPDLVIASDMSAASQVAQATQQFRGK